MKPIANNRPLNNTELEMEQLIVGQFQKPNVNGIGYVVFGLDKTGTMFRYFPGDDSGRSQGWVRCNMQEIPDGR